MTLPELREAAHLALEVAARPDEVGDAGALHVDRVDLDQRVDEVEPERAARLLGLEARRELVGDDVRVDVVHDVERDADHALVLADRADRRQADAVRSERELEARLADHVVRRRRQRRPRRAAEDEARVAALEQEREVRAAALADPARRVIGPEPSPCSSRNASTRSSGTSVASPGGYWPPSTISVWPVT